MKKIALTIALCLVPFLALAAQAPVKDDPAAAVASENNPDKLTIKDCEFILAGLKGLDGYIYIANKGKPNEEVRMVPFEFGSAKLRQIILDNLRDLEAVNEKANKNRRDTFNEYAKGAKEVPEPLRVEYSAKISDIADLPCNVKPKHIEINSLLLNKNEVPGTILQSLDKILDK